jgi:hypothetical protein
MNTKINQDEGIAKVNEHAYLLPNGQTAINADKGRAK